MTGTANSDPWSNARNSMQELELAAARIGLNPGINLAVALLFFCLGSAALMTWTLVDSPTFHTILDTGILMVNVMLAMLLLDIASRTPAIFPRLLAICFVLAGLGELSHIVAALETLADVASGGPAQTWWHTATWGVPAHILPISLGAALPLRDRSSKVVWPFVLALIVLTAAILYVYLRLPHYTAPGLFGITRPALVAVPLLWGIVCVGYWRARRQDEIMPAIALMSIIMVLGHTAILYSHAQNDSLAMIAHLGKLVAKLYLLMCVMQMGAAAMAQRIRAERALQQLNENSGTARRRTHRRLADRKYTSLPGRTEAANPAGSS